MKTSAVLSHNIPQPIVQRCRSRKITRIINPLPPEIFLYVCVYTHLIRNAITEVQAAAQEPKPYPAFPRRSIPFQEQQGKSRKQKPNRIKRNGHEQYMKGNPVV